MLAKIATLIFFAAGASGDGLDADVKTLLKSYGNKVSFSLREPGGGEVFNVNGSAPFAPASVAKLVSTGCSLWTLEPQYQFETVFGYRGKVDGETLKGDLVISGTGDPSLVVEDLREIIEKIRHLHNIKTIQGDLVFDVSYLGSKGLEIAAGFEGDAGRSFTALLTATPMNQNSFSFWVAPDQVTGKTTRATTLPAGVLDIKVSNKSKIGGGDGISVAYDPASKSATISGSVEGDSEPKGLYRSVPDTYDYYQKLIQRLWKDAGGEWPKGSYKIETASVKSKVLWKHTSKTLSRILMDVNKLSLNFGAELIFLAAGAKKKGRPASYDKSMTMLSDCFSEFKVAPGTIVLNNASGLSRDTTVQTSALTKFLNDYQQSPFGSEYLSSLSLIGMDGTAKSRLQKFAGRGRVKTGTLRDVRSIAGYLYSKARKPYSFALVFNGVSMSDPKIKALEDRIVEKILEANLDESVKP
ncbi:MAG: D-alanyl-D-alanine carboxypeptidase/D-alanyl-D-alanine-endopeptidase [Bdellovibrionia bacterium]